MIDVKALSWQAGIDPRNADSYCREDYYTATAAELEAFAALVLEAAAVKCDELWQGDGNAMQCRDAIRGMKPKGGNE